MLVVMTWIGKGNKLAHTGRINFKAIQVRSSCIASRGSVLNFNGLVC